VTGLATCEVCGNEVETGSLQCPHCHAEYTSSPPQVDGFLHRTVNLKKDMPLVQQALARLELEIRTSRKQGCKALTLIHGYGSSGEGGAIKTAVLHHLHFLHHQGRIKAIIPGEELEGRSGRGRQLLRRFPFLASHRDLNRANPGITLVIF
jgi:hypothetical protein